jgi:hypothetical protein
MNPEIIRDLDIFEAVLSTGLLRQKPFASESEDAPGMAGAPPGATAHPRAPQQPRPRAPPPQWA